jgi:hypothetical protein
MKNWQHEPIYWAPSPKLGGGWIAHKDSPSPPAAPDYAGAAQAQGAANVETARLQGQMNNANVYTPYGSQTVTWGTQPKFNEDAYNQALQQYNTQQGLYQQAQAGQKPYGSPESISSLQGMGLQSQFNPATGSSSWYDTKAGGFLDDATARQRYESSIPGMGPAPVAPTREQFTSQGIADQPNITQTLSPAQQQLLDSQNRISQNLAGVAETGLNRVSQGMQTPFDTSGLPQQQSNVQGGNYQSSVGFNPMQSGYDQGGQVQQGVGDGGALQRGLNFSGAPAIPGVNDFGAQRDEVTNALLSRSEPQFQRDEELMRTRLINQGIAPGAEASNYDLDTLNRARNDARMQATLAGSQEQSRLANLAMAARGQYTGEQAQQGQFANTAQNQAFSQGLAGGQFANSAQAQANAQNQSAAQFANQANQANFGMGQQNAALNNQVGQQQFQQGLANANLGNQARQTGIQEQAYMRQLPLNELNALRTGAQVQNPQFQPYQGSQIGQTPVFGAAQAQAASNQNTYNQQVAGANSFNTGLMGMLGQGARMYATGGF